jgi:hypothetical protein
MTNEIGTNASHPSHVHSYGGNATASIVAVTIGNPKLAMNSVITVALRIWQLYDYALRTTILEIFAPDLGDRRAKGLAEDMSLDIGSTGTV